MAPAGREFDLLLLGATGITGRVALRYLTGRAGELGISFAVGARDLDRVRRQCADDDVPVPHLERVDVTDAATLDSFAARGSVLINLVGPYTPHGEAVVRACVDHGTSYVDLTAETQFVRRIDQDWHERAAGAGSAIVHTAGFEALPADLAVEVARQALADRGERMVSADVQLSIRSAPSAGIGDSISGGTAQSIVAVFGAEGDPALDDVAFRIPDARAAALVREVSPNRLWPRITSGRVIAPMIPVAFINPPVLHRSVWLLAQEAGKTFAPLRYRDGMRFGRASGILGVGAVLAALAQSAVQATIVSAGRLPHPVRATLARLVGRALPASGAGPSGPALDDWSWRLDATALSADRARSRVRIDAEGHPGYATTARMIVELALVIADGSGTGRTGSITPALAVGAASASRFAEAGMRFTVRA